MRQEMATLLGGVMHASEAVTAEVAGVRKFVIAAQVRRPCGCGEGRGRAEGGGEEKQFIRNLIFNARGGPILS